MNAARSDSPGVPWSHEHPGRPLRVTALHDGLTSSVYVHEALGAISLAVNPRRHLESDVWSFDMLTRLDVRHASVTHGAAADIIIVAGQASTSLPSHIKSWITTCLQENRKGPPIMVVLYEERDQDADGLPPLHRDLGALTKSWKTPLLSHRALDERLDSGLILDRSKPGSPAEDDLNLDNLVSGPFCGHWGINE